MRHCTDPTTKPTIRSPAEPVTERLDRELVRRGLARSRSHAQAMINAGQVRVDGSVVERPGEQVVSSATIHAPVDRYRLTRCPQAHRSVR